MTDNQPTPSDTMASNAGGSAPAVNWQEHIPPDLKDKGCWAPVKDQPLSTVLKNYVHAQEHIGKAISIPDKEDDVEGWNKVYTRLGRPDSPDKYAYNLPKVDGLTWREEGFKDFSKVAHASGLTAKQATSVVDWFTKTSGAQHQLQTQAALDAESKVSAALKQEYGTNYPAYMGFAKQAAAKYFGPGKADTVMDAFRHDPDVLKGLVRLGRELAEDGAFGTKPYESASGMAPGSAKDAIGKIMADRTHAYWGNPTDPRTAQAYADMENLHKLAYGAAD
ncbi:putative protease [Caudoviricetes sp.]|nr:putative protease [Caudoviricetes sp.]UOF79635.1 putative protease [Caudoviricetes sp.]UOF79824.1 putative protease [Bacteriophage sp.]UOF81306.1 putative protease [Caudoviricetes sp.]